MKIKTLISAFTATCVLSSSFAVFAAEEHKLTDSFDAYEAYTNEGSWTTKNPILTEENGNKVAAFGAGTGQSSLYLKHDGFSPDVTGIIAKFSIKFEGDVKQHIIFGASSDKVPAAQINRVLQFYAGGERLQLCASANYNIYYNYTVGKWYDVTVRLNYNTGYYELTINDGTQNFVWKKTVPELKRTDAQKKEQNHYVFWIDKIANQKVLIDNVSIFGTTDERIYPTVSETEDFESFTSQDGKTVPQGFATDSTLDESNGFLSAEGAMNFVSGEGKNLSLAKNLDSEIAPPNVKLGLGETPNPTYDITLTDKDGNSETLTVTPDSMSLGGESKNYVSAGGETVSVTIKGGKVIAIISGEDGFAILEAETELSGLKSFDISSPDDAETDITIEKIIWGTSEFFEMTSASVGSGKTAPGTDRITLDFSNNLAPVTKSAFSLDGDAEVEDVITSGKSVELILSSPLSPESEYTLYYDVYDTEGQMLSDEIPFETDVKIDAKDFDIAESETEYTLSAKLKSNIDETIDAVLMLTAYDEDSGKITALDFEKIQIDSEYDDFELKVANPQTENHTVEAYLWDSLEGMNSLGFTAVAGSGQAIAPEGTNGKAEFTSDLRIAFSGKSPETQGKKASVMIYPAGADLSALSSVTNAEELLEVIDFYRQLEIGDDGSYGFSVLFDDKEKGYRDIKVTIDGADEILEKAVYVMNESDISDFVAKINSWKTPSDADSEYILENLPLIAGEESAFANDESIRDDVAKEMVNVRKAMYDGGFKTIDDIKAAFDMAILVTLLGSCENADEAAALIEEYGESSGLGKMCFMPYFDECKTEILEAICKKDEFTTDTLINTIGEKTVLTLVGNVSNHNEITDILNELNEFLELDLTKYNKLSDKSSVNKGLMKKTDSLAKFKSAFDTLVTEATKKKDGTSSSGSSSSSSGGKIVGNVTFEPTPETKPVSKNYFNDIEDFGWAKESINYLADKSIVSGVGNGRFEPSRYVTREEFVKMIVEAFSSLDETAVISFDDVSESDWCKGYVATARKKGFINGVTETSFGKGMSIKREDAAVILARITGKKASVASSFKDGADISDYAKDAVDLMWELKVINGNENGEFLPGNPLSRAECAKIIYSLLQQIS